MPSAFIPRCIPRCNAPKKACHFCFRKIIFILKEKNASFCLVSCPRLLLRTSAQVIPQGLLHSPCTCSMSSPCSGGFLEVLSIEASNSSTEDDRQARLLGWEPGDQGTYTLFSGLNYLLITELVFPKAYPHGAG
jgi:hypothetical protein